MSDDDRLERIERKLDAMAEAIVTLAREREVENARKTLERAKG